MEAAAKRRSADRVRRALTKRLANRGFVRGKPTFWVRSRQHVIEFLHAHLFTSAPKFRVHSGIRVLNDTFAATALNGPSTDDHRSGPGGVFSLGFSEDEASIADCADEMARFCSEIAEPWFERFAEVESLLAQDSPLNEQERQNLKAAFTGNSDAASIASSKQLLGVA